MATKSDTPVENSQKGSILETADHIRSGNLSPLQLVQNALGRIESLNDSLHAYICVNPAAEEEARQAEEQIKDGQWNGPLHGLPISLKDIIHATGMPTTAGSKVFGEGTIPDTDSPVARRLRAAGAVIIGKNNLHEFAYGVTSDNAHFGSVRNPWNLELIPGGSSGGSAVSVATEMCFGSIGTDTRGSIRIPAACCGVTGFKPTFGLVPTDGVIPLSPTLDHVGPLARSVEDAAVIAAVLSGDSSLEPFRFRYEPPPQGSIGICSHLLEHIDPEIEHLVWEAVDVLREAGLKVRAVDIEGFTDAEPASRVIASVEALCFHRQFLEGQRDGYGQNVLERLEAGRQFEALDLAEAFFTRRRVAQRFEEVFQEVDCLIGATVPALPPPIGSDSVEIGGERKNIVETFVRLTAAQNMAGVPALSLPCGFSKSGLPVSMQLIAWRGQDQLLLRLGHYYQTVTEWHLQRPPAGRGETK